MRKSILLTLALTMMTCGISHASEQTVSITNPMIWADVPDPDVIHVGDWYYMVSTTMHLMPGCPIMKSHNLADWVIAGYVFDRIEDNPHYDLIDGTVYGRGQWATSLRYNDGRFYVLFSPNDQPFKSFVYTATDPAGEWTLVSRCDHFHDSSLFFDDDGKVYVFSGSGKIMLKELEPDLSSVKADGVDITVVEPDDEETGLLEGSRVIKHNGKYYILAISWPNGKPRRQVCYRADNITGPYEKKVILQSQFGGFPYAGQGCIVDDGSDNWWGVIFQDRGGVGRVLTLMPCTWKDGWPMLGDDNLEIPVEVEVPASEDSKSYLSVSDHFDSPTLPLQWQWNHNPDNSLWSLTDHPGFLRLRTGRVVGNLFEAPNTISQRMEGPECHSCVKIDVSHMKDGDVAGFGAFNGHAGLLSVKKEGGKTYLVKHSAVVNFDGNTKNIANTEENEEERILLKKKNVYLKIDADFRLGQDMAYFSCSLDGRKWKEIGKPFKMIFDYRKLFMGTRFAIYNYATVAPGGYVDIDYFDY
ncbi:MAG: glycoside hydrolase 43 family protein, partial [Muribaculaceae bacterium]|nr:glycoside hydrolase 43 family protein [Muribaculaceae bacterium]